MDKNKHVNHLLKERQQNSFFGVVKENQISPPMLVVKYRSGNESAYGYHYLNKHIGYDPSKGITLRFTDNEGAESLRVEGRHLKELWEALTRHRVTFIRELSDGFEEPEEGELCITQIFSNS